MAADERAHVFDDAEQRHVHLLEHGHALPDIVQGDFLRRGHGDGAGQRDHLREGELHIAGAGRQVEQQIVQLSPQHIAEKRLQILMDHRAAPHQRRFFRNQIRHGDQLHAVIFNRDDFSVFLLGAFGAPHHHGNVGAVQVGIHQADFCAGQGQGAGQIGGDGRFAHSSLAAAHGNDMFHPRDQILFCRGLLGIMRVFIRHGSILRYIVVPARTGSDAAGRRVVTVLRPS